eukprot:480643_1
MSALSVLTSLISVFSQDRIPYRPIDPLTQRPVSKTKYKKLTTKYYHECRSDQLLHEKIWQHKLSSAPHIKEDLSLPTATCIRIRDAVPVTMTVDVGQVMQMFIGVLWNDKWDSHLKSKYIEIEGDDVKTTALISCNELYCRSMGFGGCILYENAVFGTKIIYGWPWCQKYRWKIQMVHANATSQIHWRDCFFGVISEDYNRWCAYGYCHRSGYRYHPEPSKVSNDDVYGPILKAGDIIEFELDLEHKTLQYYVNGTDLGIAWNNLENSNYRLIVTMGCKGEEIKLLKSIYY